MKLAIVFTSVVLVWSTTVGADVCKVNHIQVDAVNQTDSYTEDRKYCKNASGQWAISGTMNRKYSDPLKQYRYAFESSMISSDLKSFIDAYEGNDPDGLIPLAKEKLILAEQSECRDSFKKAQSSSDLANFIITCRENDPDKLIPKAEAMKQAALKREAAQASELAKREAAEARARELQIYRDAFRNAQSSSDLDSFASTYRGKDPDKLIPKAEAKKRVALAQERKVAERQRREDEYRRSHACDNLYAGKVVNAPVSGLVNFFGIKSEKAIILGVSSRNGVATVRSVDNSSMVGELSCESLQ